MSNKETIIQEVKKLFYFNLRSLRQIAGVSGLGFNLVEVHPVVGENRLVWILRAAHGRIAVVPPRLALVPCLVHVKQMEANLS